ncbi:hypothetical protein Aduo_008506 [Ancylostoma duodenale]
MASMAERLQHQEIVLDIEVHDDRETALMLLEDLRLYPDIENCYTIQLTVVAFLLLRKEYAFTKDEANEQYFTQLVVSGHPCINMKSMAG